MTRSHAAVVEADDETMQLSIAHGSVVCADDASASPCSMATHTRQSPGREGAYRAKRDRAMSRTRGGRGANKRARGGRATRGPVPPGKTRRARSVRRESSSQLLARIARRARERLGADGESERCGDECGIE